MKNAFYLQLTLHNFYSMINPSVIYNVYNVLGALILSILVIVFTLSICSLQGHACVSTSNWLYWRYFPILHLLKSFCQAFLFWRRYFSPAISCLIGHFLESSSSSRSHHKKTHWNLHFTKPRQKSDFLKKRGDFWIILLI